MSRRREGTYIAPHPTDKGRFIAVRHGKKGWTLTDIVSQPEADACNAVDGITPAEVEAAVCCLRFDRWDNFDRTVSIMERCHAQATV